MTANKDKETGGATEKKPAANAAQKKLEAALAKAEKQNEEMSNRLAMLEKYILEADEARESEPEDRAAEERRVKQIARETLREQTTNTGKYKYRVVHKVNAYNHESDQERQWAANAFSRPFYSDEPNPAAAFRDYQRVTRLRALDTSKVKLVRVSD